MSTDPNEAIQNFCAFTGVDDVGIAMSMLESNGWNLEHAVNHYLLSQEGLAPAAQSGGAPSGGGQTASSGDGRFNSEQIDENVWKVVEDDRPFGQYPFAYIILGVDKCVVIDTGCGTGNMCTFVSENINKDALPYHVINTHVHFDHVGGNNDFEASGKCAAVEMGGAMQAFSNNVDINSCCMAHGTTVKPYSITRWLDEGDIVYLDDSNQTAENGLCVINTPGHTPDSIALHYPHRNRLFIGDVVYPFTCMHLDCLGSDVQAYQTTLNKLTEFTASQPGIKMSAGHVEADMDPASSLSQVATLVGTVLAGMQQPVRVDDGYGEYTDGMYSIMMKAPTF